MTSTEFDASLLQRMTDQQLFAEYHQSNKDSLGQIFGHNARTYGNQVINELTSRGITEIPHPFGPIMIRPFKHR
jgi:hypothetical protein